MQSKLLPRNVERPMQERADCVSFQTVSVRGRRKGHTIEWSEWSRCGPGNRNPATVINKSKKCSISHEARILTNDDDGGWDTERPTSRRMLCCASSQGYFNSQWAFHGSGQPHTLPSSSRVISVGNPCLRWVSINISLRIRWTP